MPRQRNLLLWALWAALAVVAYRAAAAALYRSGFPLDDAWIHQTYARNLAAGLGWVYRPPDFGRGGVTAPLWVLLLALGHRLGLSPGLWVSLWGWVLLTALAVLAASWPGLTGRWRMVAALAMLGEWHLVWAAVSGMETLAFTLAISVGLWALTHSRPRWGWATSALIVGLWLRPEALVLMPLALLRAWSTRAWIEKRWWLFLLGVGAAGFAYVAFHVALTGGWGPTTGLAKTHEYAILRRTPWLWRWLRIWTPVLVGPAILAVGGVLLWGGLGLKHARRARLPKDGSHEANATSLWPIILYPLLHTGLYAWQLPVTYQHGRYIMPILPSIILLGVLAWRDILNRLHGTNRARFTFALASLSILWSGGFLILGARAYAWDVAFIESEMVTSAQWIAEHIPPSDVIAAHDIGALGYYAPQPLADLAGLLDPTVIPIIRDEAALARYLQARNAKYLMTFPSWYPNLTRCSQPLFTTHAPFAPALGGENMVVYAWQPCPASR